MKYWSKLGSKVEGKIAYLYGQESDSINTQSINDDTSFESVNTDQLGIFKSKQMVVDSEIDKIRMQIQLPTGETEESIYKDEECKQEEYIKVDNDSLDSV